MAGETGWNRHGFIVLAVIIILAVGAGARFSGGLSGGPGAGTGTLTGNVSIGPLCPVEPCSISHDRIVAAYAARPLIISTTFGTEVTRVTADPDTGYTVTLNPGTYVIDIPHQGIGGGPGLPARVTIYGGRTTWLNISIDTGIR